MCRLQNVNNWFRSSHKVRTLDIVIIVAAVVAFWTATFCSSCRSLSWSIYAEGQSIKFQKFNNIEACCFSAFAANKNVSWDWFYMTANYKLTRLIKHFLKWPTFKFENQLPKATAFVINAINISEKTFWPKNMFSTSHLFQYTLPYWICD